MGGVAAASRVADTKFSRDRGFYDSPVAVSITTRTAGARIVYTTDGSTPHPESGHAYSGPLVLSNTTVLRAAAFKERLEPSNADTQTYLFPADIVTQTGAGFPDTWGLNDGQPVRADYEMDPEVTQPPADRGEMISALKSLPTLSIVMARPDLFDPARGIYANPKATGSSWERPASVELIFPDGRPGFQVDCGIRIQGGWNRRPEESPKHSFRLVFKKAYGPGKLKFPLFGEEGVREFDTLILRAGCNNTWLHWSGAERKRGDYLRDPWMRDTYREMGRLSARGNFVHLYLNGLYWGLYNPVERPDGSFLAAHLGGTAEDYEARNADNVLSANDDGWQRLMQLANAGVPDAAALARLGEWVDLPALADFLLVNFYGGNADWDRASNWYAARRVNPPGKFLFFVWDGERTLEQADADTIDFDDDQSPPRLFHRLKENAGFREVFAARARLHLTGDGVLTPARCAARYRKLADQIDQAMLAESARWGDYRRDVHPYKTGPYELYTRDGHWRPEVRRLLEEYFPARGREVIGQLRRRKLFD